MLEPLFTFVIPSLEIPSVVLFMCSALFQLVGCAEVVDHAYPVGVVPVNLLVILNPTFSPPVYPAELFNSYSVGSSMD